MIEEFSHESLAVIFARAVGQARYLQLDQARLAQDLTVIQMALVLRPPLSVTTLPSATVVADLASGNVGVKK
jgi:hypothetical protein